MKVISGVKIFSVFILILTLVGCYSAMEKQSRADIKTIGENYKKYKTKQKYKLPDLHDNSRLGNYLTYAALKNAGMEAEFNNWKGMLEKITQVRTLPDPKFTYGYYIQEVETKVGPQQNSFSLSQTFPWYGTLMLKGGVALDNAEAQRQRYEAEKLKVFNNVKDVYYDYYYLGRALRIINKNLLLFKELEKIASERYGNAKFRYEDLIRIQIETVKYAERVDSLNDFRAPVMAKFRYVLNYNQAAGEADFPFPAALKLVDYTPETFDVLRKEVEKNPKLKELDRYIAREEKNRKIAWRRYIPDVTLGVNYIQTGKSSMKVRDNGKDPIIAMVGINLPIYFTKYEAERREAMAKKEAFKLKKIDMEKLLLSNLEQSLFQMKDSKRKMLVYRDNLIPKAENALLVIQRSYMTGKSTYLDFIDAQQRLLKYQLILEENLVRYGKGIASIEELTAKTIPEDIIMKKDKKNTESAKEIKVKDDSIEKSTDK